MRRPIIFALAGLTALGTAGIAIAHGNDNAGGLKTTPVAAIFTAAAGDNLSSRTCTGADGTYTISRGSWNGTATSSSDRLAGPLTIRGELGVNQTTGAGWLVARVRIDGSSSGDRRKDGRKDDHSDRRKDAGGELNAVIAGGKLSGFLTGRVHDEGALYASVSASVGTAGLTDGQIGGGTISPAALVVDRGRCEATPKQRTLVDARGTVSAVSPTAITVSKSNGETLTCVVGTDLAATVAKLKVGDRAAVICGLVDGSYRLLKVQSSGVEQKPVIKVEGTVSSVSATSITIGREHGGATTCAVGADLAATVARVSTGQKVKATCGLVDGSYRLLSLRSDR